MTEDCIWLHVKPVARVAPDTKVSALYYPRTRMILDPWLNMLVRHHFGRYYYYSSTEAASIRLKHAYTAPRVIFVISRASNEYHVHCEAAHQRSMAWHAIRLSTCVNPLGCAHATPKSKHPRFRHDEGVEIYYVACSLFFATHRVRCGHRTAVWVGALRIVYYFYQYTYSSCKLIHQCTKRETTSTRDEIFRIVTPTGITWWFMKTQNRKVTSFVWFLCAGNTQNSLLNQGSSLLSQGDNTHCYAHLWVAQPVQRSSSSHVQRRSVFLFSHFYVICAVIIVKHSKFQYFQTKSWEMLISLRKSCTHATRSIGDETLEQHSVGFLPFALDTISSAFCKSIHAKNVCRSTVRTSASAPKSHCLWSLSFQVWRAIQLRVKVINRWKGSNQHSRASNRTSARVEWTYRNHVRMCRGH